MRRFFFAVIILASIGRLVASPEWDPSKTQVLAASITEWPAKAGLHAFTSERRDVDLVRQWEDAGVPKQNVLFLKDGAATLAAIREGLRSQAARCEEDGTLVFCFQGHGGRKLLYCYDYDSAHPDSTVFHMDEIFPILDKEWKGNRLFLIGDCCCSGSLATVVRQFEKRKPSVRVAALASATASNLSTGNWTFTEGLIRVFAGDPLIDRNRDGNLTISEAERFLHDQMKYKEDQLASFTLSSSFEKDFVICPTASARGAKDVPGKFQVGDVVEARDSEGKWYASEILDWKSAGPAYRVHYVGWEAKWDEWVDASRLRTIVKPKLDVGRQYEVEWEKKWYLATVTKTVEDYFYFVHYESFGGEDDEWITPERARPTGKESEAARPQFAALTPRTPSTGDTVAAQWGRDWYRANVTGTANGVYVVRYDDGSSGRLAADDIVPIGKPEELRVGERVLACWEDAPQMYPGRITALRLPSVTVRWEDGSAATKVQANQVAPIR